MVEIVFKDYRFDTGLIMVFISGFVLLIWILLKLFRVIETPLIFELMPIIVGLVAIFGFGTEFGKLSQSVRSLRNDVKELKFEMRETKNDLAKLRDDFILLKADFKHFVRYKRSLSS